MLFSTPMVVALSNGSKTMTRRPQGLELVNDDELREWEFVGFGKNIKERECAVFKAVGYGDTWAEVPLKIVKGDVIWVRETFFDTSKVDKAELFRKSERFLYKADEVFIGCHKWKPSIHMPKEACRLWLKVKDVRVERLNAISEADAEKEGVLWVGKGSGIVRYMNYETGDYEMVFPSGGLRTLWQSINGDGSWLDNPWVWVYEFEKVERPEGW